MLHLFGFAIGDEALEQFVRLPPNTIHDWAVSNKILENKARASPATLLQRVERLREDAKMCPFQFIHAIMVKVAGKLTFILENKVVVPRQERPKGLGKGKGRPKRKGSWTNRSQGWNSGGGNWDNQDSSPKGKGSKGQAQSSWQVDWSEGHGQDQETRAYSGPNRDSSQFNTQNSSGGSSSRYGY